MNKFTDLNAPGRELTPEEQALLASKVLFVTTDEGDEKQDADAPASPTLH